MWDAFYIHIVCINSDLQKVYIKESMHTNYKINMYTKFIQNVYTNNCMQNGSHISKYFDSFNVLFLVYIAYKLRLGTCWLSSWR